MSSDNRVSAKDFDQEVHDLLSFLQDYEIPNQSPSIGEAVSVSPPSACPSRQPLSDIASNREVWRDEDSLTTITNSKVPMANVCESWASRMSLALREWREQHLRWTEQRLAEQRNVLQNKYEKSIEELRIRLHRRYQDEFESWKQEYISSIRQETMDPITPIRSKRRDTVVVHDESPDGTSASRHQRWHSSDGKEITYYPNGTWREKRPDGSTVVRFANGDVQTTGSCEHSQTKLCYYYGASKTLRMDQIDGSVIWCYPSGQRERHYPNGRIVVDEWGTEDAEIRRFQNDEQIDLRP